MAQLTVARAHIPAGDDDAAHFVDLRDFTLVAVVVPSTWTAASVAFRCSPGLDVRGNPESTPSLAFAIAIAAGQYRVLTAAEQRMARGLAITIVASVDPADLTVDVNQVSAVEVVLVVEPRL